MPKMSFSRQTLWPMSHSDWLIIARSIHIRMMGVAWVFLSGIVFAYCEFFTGQSFG